MLFKSFIILKKLPPAQKTNLSPRIKEFESIVRADPYFHKEGAADILLGVDTWADIVTTHIIRSQSGLIAQSTILGYAIFGTINGH